MKELHDRILNFMQKYIGQIMGLVILALLVFGLVLMVVQPGKMKPLNAKQFSETSVKILAKNKRSGGTGVILRSNHKESEILTNKHVCVLVKNGGYIIKGDKVYLPQAIKKYPYHDLCLVKVQADLGISTELAEYSPGEFVPAVISGHPALLPNVVTRGNFSGTEIISVLTDIKKCTEKDWRKYPDYCMFFDGLPIITVYEAQLVTGTIMPGSSGSGVFNKKGEIAGLVFAGHGQNLTYAFIVPYFYVVDFIEMSDELKYQRVKRKSNLAMLRQRRIKSFHEKCSKTKKFKKFCSNIKEDLVWRKR